VLTGVHSHAPAQQANVQAPFRAANHSFFEQFGSNWHLSGPGWFARFGGGPVAPPFGGAQPGAGITAGAGFAGGGGMNGGLGVLAAQGSQRSNVMQSGNLTLYNGLPGALSNTSHSPFVVGLIPVVGQGKPPWQQQLDGDIPTQTREPALLARDASPVEDNLPVARSEDPGQFSLEELARQQIETDAARQREALEHLAKAREALAASKPKVARIYYQMAERRASGELKARVAAELKSLERRAP
jgi:hypothetical protein